MGESRLELSPVAYRRVETASKLAGLVVAVAGLEVGPVTAMGLALVVIGAVLATATVFIKSQ